MQKKVSILLAALITLSILAGLAGYVPVKASLGNILVFPYGYLDPIPPPPPAPPSPDVTIRLGDNISLYFGLVTWSGGTINLYLSTNGYAALNYTTDIAYGPTFKVSDLKASAKKEITSGDLKYTIGYNWINGTVAKALAVPGGEYYIKAFDGITSAVAVTDNYVTIQASFEVVPTSGPGQASIALKGYALPARDYANLSYRTDGTWTVIKNLHQADAKGSFTYSMLAPDVKQALPVGEGPETNTTITFRMIVNSTAQTEDAEFDEFWRGLKQVKGVNSKVAAAGNLYGNLTDFSTGVFKVDVEVLGKVIIAGNHFHPGTVTILWDKATAVGSATVNGTGWFNTTISVPITSKGKHNITIDEGKTIFIFYVNVVPTLVLVPDEGPVGTTVTAHGYGFVASTTAKTYNVTLWWDFVNACTPAVVNMTKTKVNTVGQFTTTFVVPHAAGGAHIVNATEDDGPITTQTFDEATFTVKATLILSPSTFYNNGTVVTVNGTGLAYKKVYDLNLDNHKDFLVTGDCFGDYTMKFVAAAGFQPGVHVMTVYAVTNSSGLNPVYETHVLFTVNSLERDVLVDKLDEALDNLDEVKGSLGDLTDLVTDESAHLDSVRAAILAAIETTRGDVSALIQQLADIETLASTAAQQASSAAASSATAATNASDAKVASQGAQATASGISIAVYGAVILSLIAALASIVAVITLQRKVAG